MRASYDCNKEGCKQIMAHTVTLHGFGVARLCAKHLRDFGEWALGLPEDRVHHLAESRLNNVRCASMGSLHSVAWLADADACSQKWYASAQALGAKVLEWLKTPCEMTDEDREIERLKTEKDKAVKAKDFEKAAELREQIEAIERGW